MMYLPASIDGITLLLSFAIETVLQSIPLCFLPLGKGTLEQRLDAF
jgi:hypothetical protein